MKRLFVAAMALALSVATVNAQSLWTSAEIKGGIAKNVKAFAEIENRTTDGIDGTQRWSGRVGLDYKPLKWLKLGADYTFIYQHEDSRTTKKGNIIDSYWQPRHRLGLSATGSIDCGDFTFSLRERYQYTYKAEKTVAKYDGDSGSRKDDEVIESENKNTLRSRLGVEYNIRKCPVTPFASVELYNDLSDAFATDKTRYTVGAEWKISKSHSLELFYRYINAHDDDDLNVIGLGYKFSL